jgi:hypothetical protein
MSGPNVPAARTMLRFTEGRYTVRNGGRHIGEVFRHQDEDGVVTYTYRNRTGECFGFNTNRRAAAEIMVRWENRQQAERETA